MNKRMLGKLFLVGGVVVTEHLAFNNLIIFPPNCRF